MTLAARDASPSVIPFIATNGRWWKLQLAARDVSPSVIPDIFSRESILLLSFSPVGTGKKKDGFPIKNVGNDRKRKRG